MSFSTVSPVDDATKVSLACDALWASNIYPSVSTVLDYMQTHLGGGIKTSKVSPLIRTWEAAHRTTRPSRRTVPPPPPSRDEVLARFPHLEPLGDAFLALLAGYLEEHHQREAEAHRRIVDYARFEERQLAAAERAALQAEHERALAERDQAIAALGHVESSLVERLDAVTEERDRLAAALAALQHRSDEQERHIAALTDSLACRETEVAEARESLAQALTVQRQSSALIDRLEAELAARFSPPSEAVGARS